MAETAAPKLISIVQGCRAARTSNPKAKKIGGPPWDNFAKQVSTAYRNQVKKGEEAKVSTVKEIIQRKFPSSEYPAPYSKFP